MTDSALTFARLEGLEDAVRIAMDIIDSEEEAIRATEMCGKYISSERLLGMNMIKNALCKKVAETREAVNKASYT